MAGMSGEPFNDEMPRLVEDINRLTSGAGTDRDVGAVWADAFRRVRRIATMTKDAPPSDDLDDLAHQVLSKLVERAESEPLDESKFAQFIHGVVVNAMTNMARERRRSSFIVTQLFARPQHRVIRALPLRVAMTDPPDAIVSAINALLAETGFHSNG